MEAGWPGSSPFSAPTETAPARCLSSSEAEEAVQDEEEVHLRLVVLGRLQLSRYLRKQRRHESSAWVGQGRGPSGRRGQDGRT